MNGKGKLLAMLALALWLLAGCAAQIEERPMEDLSGVEIAPGAQAPLQDAYAPQRATVMLYFLSEDGSALVPVAREITVEDGSHLAQAAYRALMGGPLEGEEGVFWPASGMPGALRPVEVSGMTATVDLPARVRELPQEQLYALRQGVANTLTELPGISYVNVLVGGREEGFDLGATFPVGTLSRVDDMDVGAQYARTDELRQSSTGVTRLTTLWFPTADGAMLLPEVRSISYASASPVEYMYTLLEQLGNGTGMDMAMRRVPAPLDYIEEMPDIVRTEDGAYRAIELRFLPTLDEALADKGISRAVYIGMLTNTLMGFVPGVEGVQVFIGDERITGVSAEQTPDGVAFEFAQTLATRQDFTHYAGAVCTLYVPQDGALVRRDCVIAQSLQGSPRERLTALLRQEDMPLKGIGEGDILAVEIRDEDILVHLSKDAALAIAALSPQEERAVIYAMVNTLTQDAGRMDVRFFFDGAQVQELAGGLDLRGRMTRNPGMVVD